jgi:hypothetical protein
MVLFLSLNFMIMSCSRIALLNLIHFTGCNNFHYAANKLSFLAKKQLHFKPDIYVPGNIILFDMELNLMIGILS